jgi:hypothetical protein
LIPIILLAPICFFIDRFKKIKFGGLVIFVTIAMAGAFDENLGIYLSLFWFLVWLVVSLGN